MVKSLYQLNILTTNLIKLTFYKNKIILFTTLKKLFLYYKFYDVTQTVGFVSTSFCLCLSFATKNTKLALSFV